MNKIVLPAIVVFGISLLVFSTALPATASLVYDSTGAINGIGGWNVFEYGDQITLAGTERMVTDFSFYYTKINEGNDPNARVKFYANDGINGRPSTVLYDSGKLALQQGTGDFSYKLSGLHIEAPNTFTWGILFGDEYPLLGEGTYFIQPFLAFLKTSDTPVVGSSENYFWHYDSYMQTWIKDPKLSPISFSVKVDATTTPTPVPAAAWFLGSGLAGLAGLHRRKNNAA